MHTINIKKNVKNAFDLVYAFYQETAFLIKDLEKVVNTKAFRPANKATGAKTGNSYNRPDDWLATFTCRYWIEKAPGKLIKIGPKLHYLGCSVIFAYQGWGIEPVFAYGVMQGMDNPKAEFHHEWLYHLYHNQGGNFTYWRVNESKEYFSPPCDAQPTSFSCRLPDDSWKWPKKGVVVALPLTDISSPNDIPLLADEMERLWQRRNQLMILPGQ